MTYRNITEIKQANKAIGHYWFSPATVKHFASRVESPVMEGRYWVESTRNADNSDREYKVCRVDDHGVIRYVANDKYEVYRFASRVEALDFMTEYAAEKEAVSH